MKKRIQEPVDQQVVEDDHIAVETEVINEPSAVLLPPTEAALAQLNHFDLRMEEARKLRSLDIKGIDDKAGYKKVEEARLSVKRDKVSVEATRKKIVDPVNAFLSQVNARANALKSEFKEIEDELGSKSTAYDDAIAAERQRLIDLAEAKYLNRLNQVQTIGAQFNGHTSWKIGEVSLTAAEIRSLPDEQFINVTHLMEREGESIREAQRIEEEKVASEKAEQERLAAELKAEAERQEEERRKFEKEKADFAAEQQKLKDQAAADEKKRLEVLAKEQADLKEAQLSLRETRRRAQLEKISGILEEDIDSRVLAYKGHLLLNTDDLRNWEDDKWSELIENLPSALADTDAQIAADAEVAEKKRLKDISDAEAAAVKAQKEKDLAEKKEKDRQDALRPDKEKLQELSVKISQITDGLDLSSKEAKVILVAVEDKLSETATFVNDQLIKL